jgi:4a-hydroxytetrahydrobiopterin dehydratase
MRIPSNWNREDDKITRVYTFSNFVEAVEFVNKIVPIAEKVQHHPDVEVFGYKNVRVTLTTHDKGNTVTSKDIDLAKMIDVI